MQEKLNVLMNAFGMPVRKRIIEETLRPFRVGTCISVLPSCDDLPDLGADQFICHREQDAHDNIDWTGFRPIDEELIEAYRGTVSLPFEAGKHSRVAVKVIDPRGNEVMAVKKLD